MNLDDLIIAVFCETDDTMNACLQQIPKARLRERGPAPTLHDSEVLCMEIIGAYLGLEQDQAISQHLVRHYTHFFPALSKVHRTTFVLQATNLSHLKEHLWQHWLKETPPPERFWPHRFPSLAGVSLCSRHFLSPLSFFCRRFRFEEAQDLRATYGYDHVARQTFRGFRLHLHVAWPGLITRLTLAPAHASDEAVAPQMLHVKEGIVIGDRNYHSPDLFQQLTEESAALKLFEQLWARDVWHLLNRLPVLG